jgi:hypothetical protein
MHVLGTGDIYTGFWWGDLRGRDHMEDVGVEGGDNMKMDLQEVGWGGMDWIDLAQGRDRWLSLVHVVMSFRVP